METLLLRKYEVDEIAEAFKEGKVIAIPTDTVFGLGCAYDELPAMERIKDIKHRDRNKPLPMMCNGLAMIEEVAYVNETAKRVIERFTPGALTVVLQKKEHISEALTNGKTTIAIRVPDDTLLLDVITKLAKPILMTSANMASEPNMDAYRDVYAKFGGQVDVLVMENAAGKTASTIVDLSDGIKILREGPISLDEIREVL